MKNSKQPIQGDIEGVYLSDISNKDKVWDEHRANSDVVRDMYQSLGQGKYSLRIDKCSRLLEFALKENFDQQSLFRLQSAKFCRVRFCPVCQWRRTMMWRSRFFKAIPLLRADNPKIEFISLTLTVRNCELENLRETVEWMNKSWLKFIKRKAFPAIGWVKAIEVTKSQDNKTHPHFHCILIVRSSYFTSRDYLSKDKWIKMWQQSLKVDYLPSIKINKVYLTKKREQKISRLLDRELTDDEKVFYGLIEGLKYSIKEDDLTSDLEFLGAVTKQLHKTRAIAMGGLFKQYLSEDEPEDLIHTEIEEDIELVKNEAIFLFGWKEKVHRYQSM